MAKVLIDIPDRPKNDHQRWVLTHGGIVLDGLTNGEVMQKMFPEALVIKHHIGCDSIETISLHFKSITGYEMAFSESWWNRKWGEA